MATSNTGTVINLSSDKLLDRFADYEIKIRHHHLRRSGLDLQSSFLKIDKYELTFVPYTLSLSQCRFLIAMNRSEIDHFNTLIDGVLSVKMAFDSDIWGRRVEFVLWGKVDEIHLANPTLNVALVMFTISRVANTYREIFVDLALDNERLIGLYDDEKVSRIEFNGECYSDVFGADTVTLMPGTKLTRPFEIKSYSLRSMTLRGPVPPERSVTDELVKLILVDDRPPLIAEGVITGEERAHETDAHRTITVELDYSPDLVEIMSPFLISSA